MVSNSTYVKIVKPAKHARAPVKPAQREKGKAWVRTNKRDAWQ